MVLPRKRQRPNPAAASPVSLPTTALSREVATSHGASASTLGGAEQPAVPRPLRSYCSSAALAATCNVRQVCGPAVSWADADGAADAQGQELIRIVAAGAKQGLGLDVGRVREHPGRHGPVDASTGPEPV